MASLHRDHRGITACEQILRSTVAQIAGVLHVVWNRVGAAQLITDVLGYDRCLDPEFLETRGDLRLEDLADIHLGDAQMSVRSALRVVESGEVLGIHMEYEAFGDHFYAIPPAVTQARDDRADRSEEHT